MVRRLVLDAVWRQRYAYLMACVQVAIFSRSSLAPVYINLLSVSMVCAVFLMFGTTAIAFAPRAIAQLPVSRRHMWLSQWWLGTVVSSAVAVLAGSIGMLTVTDRVDLSLALMSFTYCMLYAGFFVWLRTTHLGRSGDQPVQPGGARFRTIVVVTLPAMLVVLAPPFLASPYLPRAPAQMTAPWAVALLAMAGFAVRGYFHHPLIEARPSMRLAKRDPIVAAPAVSATRRGLAGRLTGLRLIAWDECRKQMTTFASVIAMVIVGWAVARRFLPVPPLREFLRLVDALPFTSRTSHVTEPITIGFLFFSTSFTDLWMTTKIRAWRALPVSSARLGAIPVAMGLLSASSLWLVFLVLHVLIVAAPPVSVRPDLYLAFAGVSALSVMLRFTLPGQLVTKTILSLAPMLAIWLALGYSDTYRPSIVQPGMFVGGLLSLAISFAAMRYVVTHSSRLYQPQMLPVRFGN